MSISATAFSSYVVIKRHLSPSEGDQSSLFLRRLVAGSQETDWASISAGSQDLPGLSALSLAVAELTTGCNVQPPLGYVAPELANADGQTAASSISTAADIFSLGERPEEVAFPSPEYNFLSLEVCSLPSILLCISAVTCSACLDE